MQPGGLRAGTGCEAGAEMGAGVEAGMGVGTNQTFLLLLAVFSRLRPVCCSQDSLRVVSASLPSCWLHWAWSWGWARNC